MWQIYLVDYGLATKYLPGGEHRQYKEDPRKAHDGTVEFTSIDAHKGVGKFYRTYDAWYCGISKIQSVLLYI